MVPLSLCNASCKVLKDFENRSGPAISMQKTSFFASGLTDDEINRIQVSTGMSCGSLPFRYLGVPLNSRKLSLSNCNVLLQQMKSKFSSWSIKTLSFSGRLLLIKTVISGITTFWCSAFILPKACISKINSYLLVERWCREQKHGKSFLGYCDANKKDQGGLGVKDLYTWNKACSLRLVWLLFFRPDSVWVSWFKEVILKGSIQNYWTTKPKSGGVLDRQLESLWMPWNFPWCWYYKTRHPDKCASLQQGRILSSNYWFFLTTINLTEDPDFYEWHINGGKLV